MHVYEVHPRSDKRGVDLISDALPFGRLWYGEPSASDFVIKKNHRPPHRRYEGRLFPPEQWLLNQRPAPMTIRRSQDFPVTL
jgi:hypothetical protein